MGVLHWIAEAWRACREPWRRFDRWFDTRMAAFLPQPPVVTFDDEGVRIRGERGEERFTWSDVERIGYRTLDTLGPDHFVEFHLTGDRRFRIPLLWPGALELSSHVDTLPGTVFGERGSLANVIGNESVVVWPSAAAGGSLDEPGPRSSA